MKWKGFEKEMTGSFPFQNDYGEGSVQGTDEEGPGGTAVPSGKGGGLAGGGTGRGCVHTQGTVWQGTDWPRRWVRRVRRDRLYPYAFCKGRSGIILQILFFPPGTSLLSLNSFSRKKTWSLLYQNVQSDHI